MKIEHVNPARTRRYPFHQLTPGTDESLFYKVSSVEARLRLHNTIRSTACRQGMKVKIRTEEGGVRVWRTA